LSRLAANLLLLVAGAIWGMGFVAQATAMEHVGPWTYTAARFSLAALALLPFALGEARSPASRPISRTDRLGFLAIGAAIFLGSILQQVGMMSTSVTNAGFLTGLYVVFTPFLAVLALRAAPHWIVWPATLAAFLGIVLLGGGNVAALTGGDLLVIAAALFFSTQITLIGVFVKRTGRPLTLSAVQFAVCAGLALACAAVMEPFDARGLLAAWPEIAYGGLFSIGLAFTLQTIGQRHTTPAQAAIFLSSEALFAAMFGALFMGDRIPPIGYLGCALIFAAMLAVEVVPVLRPSSRPRPA
jgi:drug/metabolite transporter (DMT)-like permease